jgi:hypothetical protein
MQSFASTRICVLVENEMKNCKLGFFGRKSRKSRENFSGYEEE